MAAGNEVRNGGQILVEALHRNGVDTLYCVPGESYLPVLDALHDRPDIQTIVTRHEGAASNMADAYGKLTGRPGIASSATAGRPPSWPPPTGPWATACPRPSPPSSATRSAAWCALPATAAS